MIAELGSVAGRTIAIMRPELANPAYELRGGRRLLGRFQGRGRVSRVMTGEASDGSGRSGKPVTPTRASPLRPRASASPSRCSTRRPRC